MDSREANAKCPQLVIQFYEKSLKFDDDDPAKAKDSGDDDDDDDDVDDGDVGETNDHDDDEGAKRNDSAAEDDAPEGDVSQKTMLTTMKMTTKKAKCVDSARLERAAEV